MANNLTQNLTNTDLNISFINITLNNSIENHTDLNFSKENFSKSQVITSLKYHEYTEINSKYYAKYNGSYVARLIPLKTGTINASNISMGASKNKVFIHGYNNIFNASLLIPRIKNSSLVYVCPNATSLIEINESCNGKIEIASNENKEMLTLKEINIDGLPYYELTGITGTGAIEDIKVRLVIWDDSENKTVYANDNMNFYASFTKKPNGRPIFGSDVYCKISFNQSGSWSQFYDMTYDSVSEIYIYKTSFTMTNGTFLVLCNATAQHYDIINTTDTFNVSYSHWTIFYGNISYNVSLLGTSNFYSWGNSQKQGNLYVTDADSQISWYMMMPVGRDIFGQVAPNDYDDVDTNLGLVSGDNVSYRYSSNTLKNFNLFSNYIENVSVQNSTNSSAFITGLLFDASDDTNNEYDTTDKEDLIFVTQINTSYGRYGLVDYEIRVPEKLKNYKPGTSTLKFYIEVT